MLVPALTFALIGLPLQVDDLPEAVPDPAAVEVAPDPPPVMEGDAPPLLEEQAAPAELSAETLAQLEGWRGKIVVLRLKSGRSMRGQLVSFNPAGVELQISKARAWIEAQDVDGVTRPALPPTRSEVAAAKVVDEGATNRTLGWTLVGSGVGALFVGGCAVTSSLGGGLGGNGDEALCFLCGGVGALVGLFSAACGAVMVAVAPPSPPKELPPPPKARATASIAY